MNIEIARIILLLNVAFLFKLLATITVYNAEAERSFSNKIKILQLYYCFQVKAILNN